ncbi:hypothetical protein HD554DRAFT_2093885 [Boletus coccyginus]|nr:hypothetical protein HD554DRAFT_2093885 [Boletus coccyginus]
MQSSPFLTVFGMACMWHACTGARVSPPRSVGLGLRPHPAPRDCLTYTPGHTPSLTSLAAHTPPSLTRKRDCPDLLWDSHSGGCHGRGLSLIIHRTPASGVARPPNFLFCLSILLARTGRVFPISIFLI